LIIMDLKFIYTGLAFLFIFLTGFWLRSTGKPYSLFKITVHKMFGLGVGVYLAMTVFWRYAAVPLTHNENAAVVVTVLFFVVNVATGSLLSSDKVMPGIVLLVNKIFPYITLISTGVTMYLLM
jgi:hypothetical protein